MQPRPPNPNSSFSPTIRACKSISLGLLVLRVKPTEHPVSCLSWAQRYPPSMPSGKSRTYIQIYSHPSAEASNALKTYYEHSPNQSGLRSASRPEAVAMTCPMGARSCTPPCKHQRSREVAAAADPAGRDEESRASKGKDARLSRAFHRKVKTGCITCKYVQPSISRHDTTHQAS